MWISTSSIFTSTCPKGSIPKDGPSAGVTMAIALISALSGRAIRHDVAMTGEITLRGRVLPVGGLKEKLMAAHRMHMKTVLIPKRNQKDLTELPRNVQRDMEIALVERMDEIVARALLPAPPPAPKPKRAARKRKPEIQPLAEAGEAPVVAIP